MFLGIDKIIQNKFGVLATVWVTFFIIFTGFWIKMDNRPPAWDQAYYLTGAESLYQKLWFGNFFGFLSETTKVYGRKAPLIAYVPLPFYLVFGSSYHVALLSNLLFYITFSIFFYKFVSYFSSRPVALLSLVAVSTMPLFYGLARNFFVEFGLTSIFFAWLYIYLKTKDLESRKYTLLLGIVTGLGMLMKFHFFILIATPLAHSLWKRRKKTSLFVKNFIFLLLPALAVSIPWYARNILTVLWHAKRATNPELLASYYYGNPFSLNVISRVTSEIINYALSPYYLLLFVILTLILLYKRAALKLEWALVLYFLVPFLVFFFGPNKDYRLLLPVLPFFAYFLAILLELVTRGRFYLFGLSVLIPTLIFVFFCIPLGTNRTIEIGGLLIFGNNIGTYVEKPKLGNFPNDDIVKYILQANTIEKPVLISAHEDQSININNLSYSALKNGGRLKVKTVSYTRDLIAVKEIFEGGDYLVTVSGSKNIPVDLNKNNDYIGELLKSSVWQKMDKEFIFPDGSKALIYEKNPI